MTTGRAQPRPFFSTVKPLEEQPHADVRIGTAVWRAIEEVAKRASAMKRERVCPHLVAEGLILDWLISRGHFAEQDAGSAYTGVDTN